MKIKNSKDFWAGLMFIGFGLAFAIIARGDVLGVKLAPGYQMGTSLRMGPAYFPTVLGGMLAALGLVIFVRAFFSTLKGEAVRVHLPFNIVDLAVGAVVFAGLAWASKALYDNADWGMLAASVVLSILAILLRPEARALMLILTSCLAFAYLLKPLGLILSSAILIFISAFGGHEFKMKEVAILSLVLIVFSVLAFVKGLTLPFPIWPAFMD